MSSAARRRKTSSPARRPRLAPPATSDALALLRSLLADLGPLLVGAGVTAAQLRRECTTMLATLPEPPAGTEPDALSRLIDAGNMLTAWHTEPDYLDATGRPRALPRRGRVSLDALARFASPHVEPDELIRILQRHGALRRTGARWSPLRHSLLFAGASRDLHLHGLKVLRGMLRSVLHNARATDPRERWFERVADGRSVARERIPRLQRRLLTQGAQLLESIDTDMQQRSGETRAADTRHVGIGVYYFESAGESPNESPRDASTRSVRTRSRRSRIARTRNPA